MLFLLFALVVVAPFERRLATLAGTLTITTVELAALGLVAGVAVAGVVSRPAWPWRMPLTAPGVAFLAVLLAAAMAAPEHAGNAWRFVARMMLAAAVCVAAVHIIDTRATARRVVIALVSVATLVALIAVLEAAEVGPVMTALTAFRPGFHVVAGQLRATSTLFYPTITSMYLEVAFALGLWLLLEPRTRRPRLERAIVFVALAMVGAGIAATFTRAGLIAMAAALLAVGALRVSRLPLAASGAGSLAALAVVIAATVLLWHSPELLATRMRTEGSQAWYGARYAAPAALRLQTGGEYAVPLTIANTGRLTWDSRRDPMFAVSYHWLRAGSETVVQFEGWRTPFAAPVRPGEVVTMPINVRAPASAGDYTLVWDVVHETRAWLSTEGVTPARTAVAVHGAPVADRPAATMDRLPAAAIRPPRPELWRAALRIAADRPWLGIGPDNFRLVYGRYAGLPQWDTRVHANNMYLETLAGAGVPGAAALVVLVLAAGRALWRAWRAAPPAQGLPLAAAMACWLVIAGHGLVDSFLGFTTTYVTFGLAAGLAFSTGLRCALPSTEPR